IYLPIPRSRWSGPSAWVAASGCETSIFSSPSCNAKAWRRRPSISPFPGPSYQRRSPTLNMYLACGCLNATAMVLGPFADEQLGFEFLFDDSFVVAAGAQHPWARRRRIELAELANESWALPPPNSVLGSINRQAFRASGLDYPGATVFTVPAEVLISQLATG